MHDESPGRPVRPHETCHTEADTMKPRTARTAVTVLLVCMTAGLLGGKPRDPPDARRHLRAMLPAAEKVSKALEDLRRITGRLTPELLGRQHPWFKRVLEAKRRLAETPEEELAAIRQYVGSCQTFRDRARKRAQLDATKVPLAMADYALADAEYLLAEALARPGPAGHRPAQLAAARRAAEASLKAARTAARALGAMVAMRARITPECLELWRRWAWYVMEAQRNLARAPKQEVAAVREYRSSCKQMLAEVKKRRGVDATDVQVPAAEHAVAEADYILAGLLARQVAAGGKPAAGPTKKQSAQAMLAAAKAAGSALEAIERDRGVLTPMFRAMQHHWARKAMEAKVHLAPTARERTTAIQDYLKYSRMIRQRIRHRKNIDATAADVAAAEYYIAEAEYLLAQAKAARARP